jgi:hypothetical protein
MYSIFSYDSTGKQLVIPLRGLSHEACVAITQPTYWEQVNFELITE